MPPGTGNAPPAPRHPGSHLTAPGRLHPSQATTRNGDESDERQRRHADRTDHRPHRQHDQRQRTQRPADASFDLVVEAVAGNALGNSGAPYTLTINAIDLTAVSQPWPPQMLRQAFDAPTGWMLSGGSSCTRKPRRCSPQTSFMWSAQ
jgi:hypothetical protein